MFNYKKKKKIYIYIYIYMCVYVQLKKNFFSLKEILYIVFKKTP